MTRTERLDRRRILGAALELADEESVESVTMRRIAQHLGVGTMSLYHYVPNKEDLLTGMVDLVFEGIELAPDEIEGWVDRLVFVSLSFRRAALQHPVLVPLIASGYISGPGVLQSTDHYLEAIVHRGFEPEEAAHVFRCAASYVVGYLSLELGGYFRAIGEADRAGNPVAERPHLSGLASRLGDLSPDREFETGLRHLLSSFQ